MIHRVVLWIAHHIVLSFSLDADFFLVAWDGVGGVVVVKKAEKMWRKTLRMLSSVTLYCHFVMTDYVIYGRPLKENLSHSSCCGGGPL